MFVCDLKLYKKTPIIYLIQSGMVWDRKLSCEEFALHADICNLDSGLLATDYLSFNQNPGQNMRPNRLSFIYRSLVRIPFSSLPYF